MNIACNVEHAIHLYFDNSFFCFIFSVRFNCVAHHEIIDATVVVFVVVIIIIIIVVVLVPQLTFRPIFSHNLLYCHLYL